MADTLPADLAKLLASASAPDRRRAIETIAGRRMAEALPQLEKIAATDRENDVRILAERVVRFLREDGLVPTPAPPPPKELEPVLAGLRAQKVDARLEAARELLQARSPSSVPALIERAWGERDPGVKVMLARALAACADLPQRGPALGALVQAILVDLDPRVRRSALLALDAMDGREAADRVIERRLDDDPDCRTTAEGILERWGLETVLTAARSMLLSPAIGTREAAVRALSASHRAEAVPLLAWAVTDPLPPVSDAAREGLAALAALGLDGAADALGESGVRSPEPELPDRSARPSSGLLPPDSGLRTPDSLSRLPPASPATLSKAPSPPAACKRSARSSPAATPSARPR